MGIGAGLASMISTMVIVGLLVMAGLFIYRMRRRKSEDNASSMNPRPAFASAQGMQTVPTKIANRKLPATY